MPTDRELLTRLYSTAIDAADPARALVPALDAIEPSSPRLWIVALGKAAHPLAASAVSWLAARGIEPAGGIVISSEPGESPHASMATATGDHPLPGDASAHAAEELERVVRQVVPRDEVWVLLSGGTSSLIASPVRGMSVEDLREVYGLLLGAGLEIGEMNRVRKRISRWAGGRLASVLSHATVRLFALSDVIGDDIASIGSGPCSPDPSTAVHIRALLDEAGLLDRVPVSLTDLLDRTERGMVPETLKPGDPSFRDMSAVIVASNRVALRAVAAEAENAGLRVRFRHRPVRGESARMGGRIARRIINDMANPPEPLEEGEPDIFCYICGGETTVTIDAEAGRGGRCQEFALAAAAAMHEAGNAGITLLAAGTDGRDGPTDAAGAIVDAGTWSDIAKAGRDPAVDLEGHNAWASLDAVDALLRTGATGTNVMDIMIAIARPVAT
jgi:glycerate 2-kinase